MDNEKNQNFEESVGEEGHEMPAPNASRARNRTVMLTPEVTGEVRARLAQEAAGGVAGLPQGTEPAPGLPGGGTYSPAGFTTPQPAMPQQPAPQGFGNHSVVPPTQQVVPPQQAAVPQAPVMHAGADQVVWSKESPIVGFLVSYDANQNGDVFALRRGRLIVTSEPAAGGNFLVINDDTVSPMHAILRIAEDGEVQVLDQLSEHGTRIVRCDTGKEEELSGDKSTIEHGDIILFGERRFNVCIVLREEEEEEQE